MDPCFISPTTRGASPCADTAGPRAPARRADDAPARRPGPAARRGRDEEEVVAAVRDAEAAGEPLLVLAGGSNVVMADEGFPGTVVRVASAGSSGGAGAGWSCQAGEPWDPFVAHCVGGRARGRRVPVRDPGVRGRDADPERRRLRPGGDGDDRLRARVDRRTGTVEDLPPEACGFAYRSSRSSGRRAADRARGRLRAPPGGRAAPVRYAELAREPRHRGGRARPWPRCGRRCSRCGGGRAW